MCTVSRGLTEMHACRSTKQQGEEAEACHVREPERCSHVCTSCGAEQSPLTATKDSDIIFKRDHAGVWESSLVPREKVWNRHVVRDMYYVMRCSELGINSSQKQFEKVPSTESNLHATTPRTHVRVWWGKCRSVSQEHVFVCEIDSTPCCHCGRNDYPSGDLQRCRKQHSENKQCSRLFTLIKCVKGKVVGDSDAGTWRISWSDCLTICNVGF
jgi:hypothetical protein